MSMHGSSNLYEGSDNKPRAHCFWDAIALVLLSYEHGYDDIPMDGVRPGDYSYVHSQCPLLLNSSTHFRIFQY